MRFLVACVLVGSIAFIGVQAARTSCNCGWVNSGRIVGGQETAKNKYPMIAALVRLRPNGRQFCGGTILTPWHVVTAAHCTYNKRASDIRVKVGAHDISYSGQIYNVARIVNHERYNDRTTVFDIALLVTDRAMQFNQYVGPACLNNGPLDITGQKVTALGWGRLWNNGRSPDVLQEVSLNVIPFRECSRAWRGDEMTPRADNNVCTYEVRKDTCQGDSGGPLIWLDPSTGRYTLAALVSYGGNCAGPLPAVNTDVSLFLRWINDKIAATKPGQAACRKI